MELKEKYDNVFMEYIKAFEKLTELEFDYHMDNSMCIFGDYCTGFDDIKYIVDNKLSSEFFFLWYSFTMQYSEYFEVNLKTFISLYKDFRNEIQHIDNEHHQLTVWLLCWKIKHSEK
jgi:hypothetical protein